MNFERNTSREVALLERNHDRLFLALRGMVDLTTGNSKERVHAVNLLHEIEQRENITS